MPGRGLFTNPRNTTTSFGSSEICIGPQESTESLLY